jgi:hypothetical protein
MKTFPIAILRLRSFGRPGVASLLALTLASLLPFMASWAQPAYPIGNDALRLFEDWPIYREGVVCLQVSSADPLGGNADGTGYLYQEDSLFVIFDQEGPGCVYRIWIRNTPSAPNRTIKFYFDNEIFPSISVPVGSLFSGLYQNFLFPLVSNGSVSSGGNYCYLPLPFERHLKIALVDAVLPHQIAFQLYPPTTPLESYTNQTPDSLIFQWLNSGEDPKDPAGNQTESGSVIIAPNQTQTIFSLSGGGSITSLRLIPSPASLSVLEGVRLRCTWDDAAAPQVDCPMGSFFGSSLGLTTVDGLPLGMQSGELYCYIPMPFWSSAQITLYNPLVSTSVDADYTVTYKTTIEPIQAGYFCATQVFGESTTTDQDMIWGEFSGHGQLAGLVVSLVSSEDLSFLHGDLRVYVDGIAHPLMQGTDFDGDFNAGNYFSGSAFSLPVHGAPVLQLGTPERKLSVYRFFLGDLIPFASYAMIRAEHGDRNHRNIEYSATHYSFRRPEVTLMQTDALDVGDLIDEQAHNYSVQGGQLQQTHYYAHPGSFDHQFFTDAGRKHFGASSFNAALDLNNQGVRLVRRRDASIFPQSALISVNGDSVGIWWDSDFNNYRRWGESVFEIPAGFTTGLSQIQISAAARSAGGWTEYYYRIYSHIPPQADNTPPSQVAGLILSAPEDGTTMSLLWDPAQDDIGVAKYRIYRGSQPGVQPTDTFLVAETPMTTFVDADLDPGAWYYYLVAALDYAGNAGDASPEASLRTSCSDMLEAEALNIVSHSASDTAIAEYMVSYGDYWSGQAHLRFLSNATGDSISFLFATSFDDSFDVAAYFTKAPFFGIVNLSLNGISFGTPADLYAPAILRSARTEFGAVYLRAGIQRLKLTIAGKNSASTDYQIGMDNLLLTSHYLLPVEPSGAPIAPTVFRLHQNHPNPFNQTAALKFDLSRPGLTSLSVYDISGRLVTKLQNEWLSAGTHSVIWNARDRSSGLYFAVLRQGDRQDMRKMLLIK